MTETTVIIDAATRFLRGNPEMLEFARRGAGESGQGIEDLLSDAVRRIRRSGFEAIAEKQVIAGSPDRIDRRPRKGGRRSGPSVDDAGPQLVVIAAGDPRGDGQEQFVHHPIRKQAPEQ
jgi:hypothetical protein